MIKVPDALKFIAVKMPPALVQRQSGFSHSDRDGDRRAWIGAFAGLRFVLCFHIMLSHMSGVLETANAPDWMIGLSRVGYLSTSLFIVLSGYLLYYSYTSLDGTLRVSSYQFWLRRFARLYPVLLAGHLLMLPTAFAGQEVYGVGEAFVRAALVLTGLHAWVPQYAFSYAAPGWTLSVLAFGYLVFPAFVVWIRRLNKRTLLVLLLSLWMLALLPPTLASHFYVWPNWVPPFLHAFPLVRAPEFLCGVVLAKLIVDQKFHPLARMTLLFSGLVGLVVTVEPPGTSLFFLMHNGLFLPLYWMVIVGLSTNDGAVSRLLSLPILQVLGGSSLAVYMLHTAFLKPLEYAVANDLLPGNLRVWIVAQIIGMVGVSHALSVWVFSPVSGYLLSRRKLAEQRREPQEIIESCEYQSKRELPATMSV